MASQDVLLAHIVSRMQADVDFLVSQNLLSPADGQAMAAKLPGRQGPVALPTPFSTPSPALSPAPPLQTPPARRWVPPPPPHSASQTPQARAIWAYNLDGQEADDLSFNAGETIDIMEETNADWWKGKNARGQIGLFPSNYVEKIPSTAAPAYAPPSAERIVAPPPSGKSSYDPMATPTPETQVQEGQTPPKKGKFGKFGGTMAQSAAGGVGFGAGAAVGSGIINAIF